MKNYSITIACLLGVISSVKLTSIPQEYTDDMYLDLDWANLDDMEDENPDEEPMYIQHNDNLFNEAQLLELENKDIEELPASLDGYEAFGGYNRHVPERFTQEKDDRLMHSLI